MISFCCRTKAPTMFQAHVVLNCCSQEFTVQWRRKTIYRDHQTALWSVIHMESGDLGRRKESCVDLGEGMLPKSARFGSSDWVQVIREKAKPIPGSTEE